MNPDKNSLALEQTWREPQGPQKVLLKLRYWLEQAPLPPQGFLQALKEATECLEMASQEIEALKNEALSQSEIRLLEAQAHELDHLRERAARAELQRNCLTDVLRMFASQGHYDPITDTMLEPMPEEKSPGA